MWEDLDEFIEALEGVFGPEEQQEAYRAAVAAGRQEEADEIVYGPEAAYEDEGDYIDEDEIDERILEEVARVERMLGTRLTAAEQTKLLKSIPIDVWHGDAPVDFSNAAAAIEKERSQGSDRENRVERMAAAAEDVREVADEQREAEEWDLQQREPALVGAGEDYMDGGEDAGEDYSSE